jgi:hypothetical protein
LGNLDPRCIAAGDVSILQLAGNAHRLHDYARPREQYRHLPNNARNPIIINPTTHPAAPAPAIPQQSRSNLIGRNRNQTPSDTNTIDSTALAIANTIPQALSPPANRRLNSSTISPCIHPHDGHATGSTSFASRAASRSRQISSARRTRLGRGTVSIAVLRTSR